MEQGRRGFGGRPPKGLFGGAAGLLLLAGGAIVISNSLFNGMARDTLFILLPSSLLFNSSSF